MQIFGNLIAAFYLLSFLIAGMRYAFVLLPKENIHVRVSAGISLGLFAQMWLPSIFSFFLKFTLISQILGLIVFLIPMFFFLKSHFPKVSLNFPTLKPSREAGLLCLCVIPSMILSAYLLCSHTLRPEDGALYTGQSCYGDMCMHLSFITSIARNGIFPPEYSIEAGVKMGYPFLCDSISSTYLLFGADLRFSYILPMIPALYAVFSWYFHLMTRFLHSPKRAALAYVLFFISGGLGIIYFLDGAEADPSVFTRIFSAFYETPTNNVANNVYWVNPIADLLIPQRATLFGWSILLPCLYLLYRLEFENESRYCFYIGLLAGGLPLLHTHSFLSLAVISAGCMIRHLILSKNPLSLKVYLIYLIITLIFSVPQLICFTFSQASNSGFLHFTFNWINKEDPYLWFYIKNIGLVFLLLPFALLSEKRVRSFWLCTLPLWLLCEFIVFQPNDYDNNKLLFVVHMISCGIVASFLATLWHKMKGLPARSTMLAFLLLPGIVSGSLTLSREVVSNYQIFSVKEVAAAKYAAVHLPKDAVLLTADEHKNPFSSLAGLTIVQGSPSYLYYHGVYDTERAADVIRMYTEEGALSELALKYGITHVVLSSYEVALGADVSLFEDLPVFFSNGEITIYSLS